LITNILTVDVEDYFHVSAFESIIPRASWQEYPARVQENTSRVLDLLEAAGVHATFFILGWIAERYPALLREIISRGHEIASHGQNHGRVRRMSPEEFREDLRASRGAIEDACGKEVRGYRAPSFSVTRGSFWYLDVLAEEGIVFDSSIFPVRHDHYGIPDFERFPTWLKSPSGANILEIPPSTIRIFGRNLPMGGGGFLRLFPLPLFRRGIRFLNDREGQPAVLYFHPWEIDPGQPRIPGIPWKTRFRHYCNLERTEGKIRALLSEFSFGTIQAWMEGNG
jgi:polysaccharide deacetylase family protein (PEP-CTERM system associated)